jgi:hypothetical protein
MLIASVMESMKIQNNGVNDTGNQHKVLNISTNFHTNSKWPSIGFSEARGKRIREKILKSKISCHTPYKFLYGATVKSL